MFNDSNLDILDRYKQQFENIFSVVPQISDIKPSAWAEKNVIIPGKGQLDYRYNPYCKEIIDTLAPDHPARVIAVMKGSQITFSSGVLMPALGYNIVENPCNTYLMVGTTDLLKPAGQKLDLMIDGAKIRKYISDQSKRKIRNKSGDTDEIKYYAGGYIKIGSATNPKSIAQVDLNWILLDDYEMIKGNSKIAGNFKDLIEIRAASNANTYKLMMISTPLTKSTSNIEPAFLYGDRRRYFIDCPCCHKPIIFKRNINEGEIINPLLEDIALTDGGIRYKVNQHGQLIKKSVRFVCYKCGDNFTDKNKQQMIRDAAWIPTAIPQAEDYYSYHISAWYAPINNFNWAFYANKEIEANPGGVRNEYKHQVQVNTCDGETYEPPNEAPKATEIMKNKRDYPIGMIPDQLSEKDGNGKIVLVTMGADMNGLYQGVNGASVHDARIDYVINAWSEKGPCYVISHGSIGTFISREGQNKADRVRWTYEPNKQNSVWPEFDRICQQDLIGQSGLHYKINSPGIDCGYLKEIVSAYMDWTIGRYPGNPTIGLRGNKEEKYVAYKTNIPFFTVGVQRNDVYFLQVGLYKDAISNNMLLKCNEGETQPAGFMNFPYSANGMFEYENFFEHFESEHRTTVVDKDGTETMRWMKKGAIPNHMWDCFLYSMAGRDIVVKETMKVVSKDKVFSYPDFVNYVLG